MHLNTLPPGLLGQGGALPYSPSLGLLQRLVDIAVILCAGLLANAVLGFSSLLPLVFAVLSAALFVSLGELHSLYHSWRAQTLTEEVGAILLTAASALLGAGLIGWLATLLVPQLGAPLEKHGLLGSFFGAAMWSALVVVTLLAFRLALRTLLRALRTAGFDRKQVFLIGQPGYCRMLESRLATVPWLGMTIVGREMTDLLVTSAGRAELVERARAGEFEHLYLLGCADRAAIANLLADLADLPVSTYLMPDIFFDQLMQPRVFSIAGLPAIGITTSPLLGAAGWLKRAEDLVLGTIILCLIAAPMLVIAAAVRLTSPGPALFRQVRYGLDGKPITVFKFRTMTVCENGDVVLQARRNDQRITPLGAVLRRTSLDELPQFLNVLRGEMSIVGPRPHARAHNEYYRRLIPNYMLRHKIKPGITGWAQVNGWRGETDELYKMEKRVEFDLDYIRNWSVWFDLRIVFRTVFHVVFSKDVY